MKTKTIKLPYGTFKVPVTKLKNGQVIMTRPFLGREIKDEFARHPEQPACLINFEEAQSVCRAVGGQLPTEEEWLEIFGHFPYFGGILEWCDSADNDESFRVLRGGSWFVGRPASLSCACRCNFDPGYRFDYIGFRCVWEK